MERVVVIGNGMVGHRFVTALCERDGGARLAVTVLGEEPRAAYDRVHLSDLFCGPRAGRSRARAAAASTRRTASSCASASARSRSTARARVVTTSAGARLAYDRARARHRLRAVRAADPRRIGAGRLRLPHDRRRRGDPRGVRPARSAAIVIGGGLLGLEAAKALLDLGLETHVVEAAPRLMPRQLDDAGAAALRASHRGARRARAPRRQTLAIEAPGGATTKRTTPRSPTPAPRRASLAFADGGELAADLVVVSAGIRPRDELARELRARRRRARRHRRRRRAAHRRPARSSRSARSRCTAARSTASSRPGYEMADVLAGNLARPADETPRRFDGRRSLDAAQAARRRRREPRRSVRRRAAARATSCSRTACATSTQKLVLAEGSERLLGGVLVGDASRYAPLARSCCAAARRSPQPPEALLFGAHGRRCGRARRRRRRAGLLVQQRQPRRAVPRDPRAADSRPSAASRRLHPGRHRLRRLPAAGRADPAGASSRRAGRAGATALCEHFAYTRQELFQIVQVTRTRAASTTLLASHGRGAGCEICKPAVASILASLWNEPILEQRHAPGHQRPLPRQHPARRHLLGRAARAGRRDHAREADRARRGREALRPLLQDHRRPAHRPVRRARRAAARHLGRRWSTPASRAATPTARRCAP